VTRLLALGALGLALALPNAAQAQVERGSPLQRTPYQAPPQDGNDCKGQPNPDNLPTYQFVDNGSPSCSWAQQGVSGATFTSDPRSGFVGQDGVVTSITVKTRENPASLRFFAGRQLTPAQNGNPAGNPQCCFFLYEVGPFQPAADTTSTFPVNMPVESNAQPTIITNDFIGFSANSNTGTLPLARVSGQDHNGSYGTPGTLNAMGFWPAMGQLANDQGGGRTPGGYGGIEVLLRYTVSPRAGSVPGPPIRFQANQPIAEIGGSVLKPIGRELDVIINCLQANCNGALDLLTRNRVLPASKKAKKIRSLGKKRFSLKQGKRKVRFKLNKLGRKLARRKRTKVTLVLKFSGAPTVTKKMTLAKAGRKKSRPRKGR
jgi:hypothetical protein